MLEIKNLGVAFRMGRDFVPVTREVDLGLEAGGTLGIVGESGSGKSVTSMAVMGLLPRRGSLVTADRLAFEHQQQEQRFRVAGQEVALLEVELFIEVGAAARW